MAYAAALDEIEWIRDTGETRLSLDGKTFRAARWHQARKLSGEQPSLGAIARYAALSLA